MVDPEFKKAAWGATRTALDAINKKYKVPLKDMFGIYVVYKILIQEATE